MADTTTYNRSAVRTTEVILGLMNSIELMTANCTPLYDTNQTLNYAKGVFANQKPKAHPTIGYFGIGIGGNTPTGQGNIMRPQEVQATNEGLYEQIPFRCVPIEQDLDDQTRAQYAMREVFTHTNGHQYVRYWLKRLVWNDAQVQFAKFDTSTNQNVPYKLDSSNLSPVPPAVPVDGTTPDISDEVSVFRTASLPILGSEVYEVLNTLYDGDTNRASITEVGIYTGNDEQVTVQDYKGNPFNYQEAIMAQLFCHNTNSVGEGLQSSDSLVTQTYRFTSSNMAVAQNNGSRI